MTAIPEDMQLDKFLDGQAAKLPEPLPDVSALRPPSPKCLQFPLTTSRQTSDEYDDEMPEFPSKTLPTSPSKSSLFTSSLFRFPRIQSSLESSLSILQDSASGLFNVTAESTKLSQLPPTPAEIERQQRIQEEVEYARQFVPRGPSFSIIRPLYSQPVPSEQQHINLPKLSLPNPLHLLKPGQKQQDEQHADVDADPFPATAQLSPEELEKQRASAAILKRRMEEVKLMEEHQQKLTEYRLGGFASMAKSKKNKRAEELQNEYGNDQDMEETDDLSGLSHDLQKRLYRARGLGKGGSDDFEDDDQIDTAVKSIIATYNVTHSHLRSHPPCSPSPQGIRVEETSTHKLYIASDVDLPHPALSLTSPVSQPITPTQHPQHLQQPTIAVTIVSPLEKVLQASEELRQLQRKQSATSSRSLSNKFATTDDHLNANGFDNDPNPFTSPANSTDIMQTQAELNHTSITSCEEESDSEFEPVKGFALFAL
jgi:hypothetical protein